MNPLKQCDKCLNELALNCFYTKIYKNEIRYFNKCKNCLKNPDRVKKIMGFNSLSLEKQELARLLLLDRKNTIKDIAKAVDVEYHTFRIWIKKV